MIGKETYPSAALATTDPTLDLARSRTRDPLGVKSATNRLFYGTGPVTVNLTDMLPNDASRLPFHTISHELHPQIVSPHCVLPRGIRLDALQQETGAPFRTCCVLCHMSCRAVKVDISPLRSLKIACSQR
jgi:hypothetical protein